MTTWGRELRDIPFNEQMPKTGLGNVSVADMQHLFIIFLLLRRFGHIWSGEHVKSENQLIVV